MIKEVWNTNHIAISGLPSVAYYILLFDVHGILVYKDRTITQ